MLSNIITPSISTKAERGRLEAPMAAGAFSVWMIFLIMAYFPACVAYMLLAITIMAGYNQAAFVGMTARHERKI